MKKTIFYLPDGFADWEGAFLMAELAENKRPFTTVSETGGVVASIGRLKVQPDASLADIPPESIGTLVLIGSDGWVDPSKNKKVLALAGDVLKRGDLLAGICASTIALAREGLLDGRKHTSNDLGALKRLVPTYRGEANYQQSLALRDGNLITAPGVGALEFTLELLRALDVYNEEKRDQWYALFKKGTPPPPEFWA